VLTLDFIYNCFIMPCKITVFTVSSCTERIYITHSFVWCCNIPSLLSVTWSH